MIGQYLPQTNENATVPKFEIFLKLNKAQRWQPKYDHESFFLRENMIMRVFILRENMIMRVKEQPHVHNSDQIWTKLVKFAKNENYRNKHPQASFSRNMNTV
jgi:hypothetical protein